SPSETARLLRVLPRLPRSPRRRRSGSTATRRVRHDAAMHLLHRTTATHLAIVQGTPARVPGPRASRRGIVLFRSAVAPPTRNALSLCLPSLYSPAEGGSMSTPIVY